MSQAIALARAARLDRWLDFALVLAIGFWCM
jgi:t-SNARE complex subunit (syntaxin)